MSAKRSHLGIEFVVVVVSHFPKYSIIQGVLEIRGMFGEWKNREFRNREYQGMAVRQVFEPLYSFKVSIWGLCNNCN